jgi:hypothetical protein
MCSVLPHQLCRPVLMLSHVHILSRQKSLHYIRTQFPDHPTYPYTAETRQAARANLREYANSLQGLVGTALLRLHRLHVREPTCESCMWLHTWQMTLLKSVYRTATSKECKLAELLRLSLFPVGLHVQPVSQAHV